VDEQPIVAGRRWVGAAGVRVEVRNPADGSVVGTVFDGGHVAIDDAVQAARSAWTSWRSTASPDRGRILVALAEAIVAHLHELAPLLTAEVGKPLREARIELDRCAATLRYYGNLADRLDVEDPRPVHEPIAATVVRRPIGVVGAIIPWNFPTTLLANKLGPALAVGNVVVAKPDLSTPFTTLRIAELASKVGLPSGVLNVVPGGPTTGSAIVAHPDVRKVSFTGSTQAGRDVLRTAAWDIKRVTAELGGSDPLIITDDANIDAAVSAAAMGRFFNCGQACLAVKRVYVTAGVADRVIEGLTAKIGRLTVGNGAHDGTRLGPMHSEEGRERLLNQLGDAVDSGGEVTIGGEPLSGGLFDDGWYMAPTLVVDPKPDSSVATTETFGPLLPVWTVADLDEAIERANDSSFGLGSSVWCGDPDAALDAARRLEAGYTWVNTPVKVFDELPFGGVKQSGFGREHGIEALSHYTDEHSIVTPGPGATP